MTSRLDVTAAYRAYGDMVLRRCQKLLRDDSDAENARQEIFLQLHRSRQRYRGDVLSSSALNRLITTHCMAMLQARQRRLEAATKALEHNCEAASLR